MRQLSRVTTIRLRLWSGYAFSGAAGAGGGSGNTLTLGGIKGSTFDLSSIGMAHSNASFRGFSQYEKTGSSIWTVTGIIGGDGPWTVQAGTLLMHEAVISGSVTVNATLSVDNKPSDILGSVSLNDESVLNVAGKTTIEGGLKVTINNTISYDFLRCAAPARVMR